MQRILLILIAILLSSQAIAANKNNLRGGLYSWGPYQFIKPESSGDVAKGMDIEFAGAIANIIGAHIKLDEVTWEKHQRDIEAGLRDIAFGVTYNAERAKYAHFSLPYRFEDNSLFTLKKHHKKLDFKNAKELIESLRKNNYKLGVTEGYVYANAELNDFINDPANIDIIIISMNDLDNLKLLTRGHIDGFLADRISGSALVVNNKLESKIEEQRLGFKIPVHIMFSKKTINQDLVDKFDGAIKAFVTSDEYKVIIKKYLYPILLLETVNADWFFIIGLIGTISFAISGLAIAAKENSTLFGTFVFAMLPSVGGTIIRDVMAQKGNVMNLFQHPIHMYLIIFIVLVGFIFVRLVNVFDRKTRSEEAIYNLWENILIISDSLGQASFIISGVVVVVIENISPLWLWAPFFAFVTANGGVIIRDMLRRDGVIAYFSGSIGPEVSLLWGVVLGILLENITYNPTAEMIQKAVIIVVLGAFITQMIAHYFKIPNIKFKPRKKKITDSGLGI
jgi:polar amino acid transport system substrate-binding protein